MGVHRPIIAARRRRDSATADWYLWRDPKPGTTPGEPGSEPNNWGSAFSGSAWEWVPERGQFYLHLFSRKQPDLNWENPEVRAAVFAMMNWWLDRGIDGFRMDVVNFICKDPAYPDGTVTAGGFGDPMPFTTYGPHIHEHLAEMKREVFDTRPGSYLTVGEMPGVTPEQARRFTDAEHGQLNMVFQFEHVDLDSEGGKWGAKQIGVLDLKRSLGRWQAALAEHGWNSLYWNNHDQPRVVSRFGNDSDEHWFGSATALATVLHLHRGTPYVYQGEELGMTNVPFDDVEDFRDIESVNHYAAAVARGADPEQVLADLRRKSRDNARTPMQWSAARHAGFTTGTPWIPANPNHTWLNAENQRHDPNSVYAYYRRLIALRHSEPVLVHGDFTMLLPDHPSMYAFTRTAEEGVIACYANLTDERVVVDLPAGSEAWALVLANRPPSDPPEDFAPWEARVYRVR